MKHTLEPEDRAIVTATQAGLPLVARPYEQVAKQIGLTEADVLARITRLIGAGVIRRIGIVPNHYALGLRHNAMTVWDVADEDVSRLGTQVGALPFVTHCYRRPRRAPIWTYNLFAMVHGRSDDEVRQKRAEIERLLGSACRASDVLMSTRVLKKTGLRIKQNAPGDTRGVATS